MRILIDTHIALWYLNGDPKLPISAIEYISNPQNMIYFSLVSMWEIEIKHNAHPDQMRSSGLDVLTRCANAGFMELPLLHTHIPLLETLHRPDSAPPHKDPFDKMLIAQAKAENLLFLTHDALLPHYGEPCILKV